MHLQVLAASGLVKIDATSYTITDAGVADIAARESAGAGRLLQLKAAIKRDIEDSIQAPIIDEESHRVWLVLEDNLTQYFITRGEEIVSEIAALIDQESTDVTAAPGRSSSLTFP